MPSREVVQHFEDVVKEATGEGPVQEITIGSLAHS